METVKNIFIIVQAGAGIAFSIFMMWQMWKVKKGVEKVSDNVMQFSQALPGLVDVLVTKKNGPPFSTLPEAPKIINPTPLAHLPEEDEEWRLKA